MFHIVFETCTHDSGDMVPLLKGYEGQTDGSRFIVIIVPYRNVPTTCRHKAKAPKRQLYSDVVLITKPVKFYTTNYTIKSIIRQKSLENGLFGN